ncbi:MAG: hypothetical protein JXR96_05490, partial [Deltaproteobacteria bacterium]|nr:hypothetical protein [Deltaproteobacteria bacterium]
DGDGYGEGEDCDGPDCDDDDAGCWAGACCTAVDCVDADGDGHGEGEDCAGPDCDDLDPGCFVGDCCSFIDCLDLDGDGYGEGTECAGWDCDEADPGCYEGGCCPEMLSCVDILDCMLGCADQACMLACLSQGDPSSQELAVDVFTCAMQHGCQNLACLTEHCPDQVAACTDQLDCVDADSDGFGDGPVCAGPDCNDADPACWSGVCCPEPCLDGDGDGYGHGDCAGLDCNDSDPACWEGACCDAYSSCMEIMECVIACADQACMQACVDQGDPESQRLAYDLYVCSVLHACSNLQCLWDNCPEATAACYVQNECLDEDGDGHGVGGACMGSDCDDGDVGCWTGSCCAGICQDADGDGYGEGETCSGSDCDEQDASCWAGACCPQYLSCAEVLACTFGCSGNLTCIYACIDQGDPEARDLAWDLMICTLANGCTTQICLWEHCAEATGACMGQTSCRDLDGDGFGDGLACLGPDCDDADPACWQGECCPAEACVDADGDGYGVGADCAGPDCDDEDVGCWIGACCLDS